MYKEKLYKELQVLLAISYKVLFVVVLFVFPSCFKTYKMVSTETPQGSEYEDQREVVKNNLRSVRVYREWETDARFDVLWMSDQTVSAYVNLYCVRRGKDEIARTTMVRNQMQKNQEELLFYVLADVRDRFHPLLSDSDAAWTMYIKFGSGDKKSKVSPVKIEEVELDPEILVMFGHRFTKPKFKKAYKIVFPIKDSMGRVCVLPGEPFKMVLSSTCRKCVIGWQGGNPVVVKKVEDKCHKKRKFLKDEDYYWL